MHRKLSLIGILVSLLFCSSALAQETMKEITGMVIKAKKPGVVYLFSTSCGYCNAMDRDVLGAREIREELRKNVVFVRVDGDRKPLVARENSIRGFPTTILLDETGRKLIQIPGYIGKRDFKTVLLYLTGGYYRTMSLGEYLQKQGSRG